MVNLCSSRKMKFESILKIDFLSEVVLLQYIAPVSAKHNTCKQFYLINYKLEDNKYEIVERIALLYDRSLNERRFREMYDITVIAISDAQGILLDLRFPLFDFAALEKQLFDDID